MGVRYCTSREWGLATKTHGANSTVARRAWRAHRLIVHLMAELDECFVREGHGSSEGIYKGENPIDLSKFLSGLPMNLHGINNHLLVTDCFLGSVYGPKSKVGKTALVASKTFARFHFYMRDMGWIPKFENLKI